MKPLSEQCADILEKAKGWMRSERFRYTDLNRVPDELIPILECAQELAAALERIGCQMCMTYDTYPSVTKKCARCEALSKWNATEGK